MPNLVKRLEALVILDEVNSNNQLGKEAAARIRELETEAKFAFNNGLLTAEGIACEHKLSSPDDDYFTGYTSAASDIAAAILELAQHIRAALASKGLAIVPVEPSRAIVEKGLAEYHNETGAGMLAAYRSMIGAANG